MLVPAHVEVARRLCGKSISWGDYARAILKQAHENFNDYGSRCGTGPWYVSQELGSFWFSMKPIVHSRYDPSYRVRPSTCGRHWIFEMRENDQTVD